MMNSLIPGFSEMTKQHRLEYTKQLQSGKAFRSSKRLTITIPYNVYEYLLRQSDEEGRSLSGLAAFALETVVRKQINDKSSSLTRKIR